MTNKDPYSVLGITRDNNEAKNKEQAKKAYRKLAMQYHPDRNPGDEAAKQRFIEVSAAYEAITNPPPPENNGFGDAFGGGFGAGGDFWAQAQDMFGGGPTRSARPRPSPSQTHRSAPPRQPAAETYREDWADMFDVPPSQTAASGNELAQRAAELTNKFNMFAGFINNAINLRRAAHDEYGRRSGAEVEASAEIMQAEQLFDTLTRRDSAVTLMEQTAELTAAARQAVQPDAYAQILSDVTQMEKRLENRQAAVVNALDVIAGRADKLRYKPKEAGPELKL
jgi:curved DNA-binding protein CbpA